MLSHASYRCVSLVVMFTLAIWSGFGQSAQAQEADSLKGVAVFEGEGMLFQVRRPQVSISWGDTSESWLSAMTRKP